MTPHDPLAVHLPDDWTPEQAAACLDLLEEIVAAIRDRYELDLVVRPELDSEPPEDAACVGTDTDDDVDF